MPVELLPGVWWMERTRGCNAYLARADDGSFVLIDPGFARNANALIEQAREVAAGAPVTHVLLTHGHFDHAASAQTVARALGARVALGRGDCEADGDPHGNGWHVASALARRRGLRGGPGRGEPVRVDEPLDGACEVAPGIEAIPTPGHTAGSMCFVVRRAGVAFVGDLVISHEDGLARSLRAANLDDGEYLRTLSRFAEVTPDAALAGHGYPVLSGFSEALQTLAAQPRERGGVRVVLRRAVRMARFMTWMVLPDRPPRR
jgi:glyoxylase-like metal-dependent hydrolase (beta-lactamase superfamily II)